MEHIKVFTKKGEIKYFQYNGVTLAVTKDRSAKECLQEFGKQFGREFQKALKLEPDKIELKRNIKGRLKLAVGSILTVALTLGMNGCESNEEEMDFANVAEQFDLDLMKNQKTPDQKELDQNYENKTVAELINLLPEEIRKAWTTMDDYQDYFNNTAAPSIKIAEDNGAQLYLKSKEVGAFYILANSHYFSTEELAKIFKGSALESNEDFSSLMMQASKVLWTYYAYATESSGISMLYENESDQKIVEQAENYVLRYNETKDQKVIDELNAWLQDLFFGGHIDKITEMNPGATSYIGNILLPLCKENGWIAQEQLEEYESINEGTTCDYFLNNRYQDIKKAIESSALDYEILLTTENKEILEYLIQDEKRIQTEATIKKILWRKMNEENIKVNSRDIKIELRELMRKGLILNSDGSLSESRINEEIIEAAYENKEVTREEIVEVLGEEAVKEIEHQADDEFHKEYDEYNKAEEQKAQNITAAYNLVYYTARENAQNGKTKSEIVTIIQNVLRQEGINTVGMNVSDWINAGYEDGHEEWIAQNTNNNHEEITEEDLPKEATPNVSEETSNQENSSTYQPEPSVSEETVLPADEWDVPEEPELPSIPSDEESEEILEADQFALPEDSEYWEESFSEWINNEEEITEEFFEESSTEESVRTR